MIKPTLIDATAQLALDAQKAGARGLARPSLSRHEIETLRRVMRRAQRWPLELSDRLGWGPPSTAVLRSHVEDAVDGPGLVAMYCRHRHKMRWVMHWLGADVRTEPGSRSVLEVVAEAHRRGFERADAELVGVVMRLALYWPAELSSRLGYGAPDVLDCFAEWPDQSRVILRWLGAELRHQIGDWRTT